MESRAMFLFENSIKSPTTRTVYLYELERFVKYYKLKSIESTLKIDSKKLQIMMDWVMHVIQTEITMDF